MWCRPPHFFPEADDLHGFAKFGNGVLPQTGPNHFNRCAVLSPEISTFIYLMWKTHFVGIAGKGPMHFDPSYYIAPYRNPHIWNGEMCWYGYLFQFGNASGWYSPRPKIRTCLSHGIFSQYLWFSVAKGLQDQDETGPLTNDVFYNVFLVVVDLVTVLESLAANSEIFRSFLGSAWRWPCHTSGLNMRPGFDC